MLQAPLPNDEERRLSALYEYRILDTPAEEAFDRVIRLVCRLFSVPMATITLVDRDRQWFKSSCGVDACETERGISFCGHVVFQGAPLIVPDTHEDPRFADNPLVTGPPYVRFYAGVPLTTYDGLHIGVLCVQDKQPRPQGISADELANLTELAAMTLDELELRKAKSQVDAEQEIARRVINCATQNEVLGNPGVRHYYRPAERLSGDLLLAGRRSSDGALLFLLGDFTGHGIGAAVGVPALAGKFYDQIELGVGSEQILGRLNDHLRKHLPPDMFLTAALIEVSLRDDGLHLAIWNAGLPSILLISAQGQATHFASEGLPLGIVSSTSIQAAGLEYHLPPAKSRLYACSDGVVESRTADGGLLGVEGLERNLCDHPSEARFDAVVKLMEDAREHNSRDIDDITFLELDFDNLSAMLSQQ
ncbi:SpoIIE family protein phosphatase [Halorhodospira halochloris]|uniref:PP2C family protein-serine/threonine phosphatase n=1 Tax=Halorhodospira halochloris TaxID=1052 RepID=UPI001EE8A567|nr:GAF domain-containing SpoIIE family protein phosphatase [Halorhodospira halochloris]MCG5531498.1 SpoIIE family protein phosphatase [Halorhodospira halochloris]